MERGGQHLRRQRHASKTLRAHTPQHSLSHTPQHMRDEVYASVHRIFGAALRPSNVTVVAASQDLAQPLAALVERARHFEGAAHW